MAIISTLGVSLAADTRKFDKGMKKGSKQLKGFEKTVSGVGSKVKLATTAIAGFGAALAGLQLGRFIADTFDAVAQLQRVSDQLKVNVVDLQVLRRATRNAGVDVEKMDDALRDLGDRLGDAATDGGAMADAFNRIGINAAELIQIDPADQFIAVSNAMQTLGTQSERLFTAMELFGDAGAELLPIMETIAADYEKLSEDPTLLTEDQVREIAEADKAFKDIRRAFQDIGRKWAPTIATWVNYWAQQMDVILLNTRATILEIRGGLKDIGALLTLQKEGFKRATNFPDLAGGAREDLTQAVGLREAAVSAARDRVLQQMAESLRNIDRNTEEDEAGGALLGP